MGWQSRERAWQLCNSDLKDEFPAVPVKFGSLELKVFVLLLEIRLSKMQAGDSGSNMLAKLCLVGFCGVFFLFFPEEEHLILFFLMTKQVFLSWCFSAVCRTLFLCLCKMVLDLK